MTEQRVLKGGYLSRDPRLDRIPQWDERNRDFPIRALIRPEMAPRSYTWASPIVLDQGNEGACVGFAWAHELAARPVKVAAVSSDFARRLYHEAQDNDEWPGHDYEGSSTLGGAKAVSLRGYMQQYRWALDLNDLVMAVGHHGPVIVGINWYDSMFVPDAMGNIKISPNSSVAGGHDILINAVSIHLGKFGLVNSWGYGWGLKGRCFLSWDDMNRLIFGENGDACVPIRRMNPVAS